MVKQISNEEVLKEIHEEMVELESKKAKWDPNTDSLQLIKKCMEREEELIYYRFEVLNQLVGVEGCNLDIFHSSFLQI